MVYIHLNPVKHGFTNDFETYRYSSYKALLYEKQTQLKRDEAISGLIVPVIAILIFYYSSYAGKSGITIPEFIEQLIALKIYTQLISLCVVPNLLLFFIFIWIKLLYSARGVILATFLYVFLIIVLKYFI